MDTDMVKEFEVKPFYLLSCIWIHVCIEDTLETTFLYQFGSGIEERDRMFNLSYFIFIFSILFSFTV